MRTAELRLTQDSSVRALIDPKTINAETREFEIVWSTGVRGLQYGYIDGEGMLEFDEELEMTEAAWDLSRVAKAACPLLDSHGPTWGDRWGGGPGLRQDQIGRVLEAWIDNGKGRAKCRFSFNPQNEGLWLDVQRGVITSVSPRYRVLKYREVTSKTDKRRVFRAMKSELREISLLPIPMEAGARVRAERESEYPAELALGDGDEPMAPKPKTDPENPPAPAAPTATDPARSGNDPAPSPAPQPELTRGAQPAVPPVPAPVAGPAPIDQQAVIAQERARVAAIQGIARTLQLEGERELLSRLVDQGASIDAARGDLLVRRSELDRATLGSAVLGIGRTERDKVRSGIENALLHRVGATAPDDRGVPRPIALTEQGRDFRGMTLLRMAEHCLQQDGVRTLGMTGLEIATAALEAARYERVRSGGMHTGSDFPSILSNVMNKVLRDAYAAAPSSWRMLGRRVSANDFKTLTRLQLGEAPRLELVPEHGEFKRGTIKEGKETYVVKTYGKIFAITRQALINDDTSAFDRVPMLFGRQAAENEASIVWGLITANVTMADGLALFHNLHANKTSGAIDITSLTAARKLLRLQKGLDGVTLLNLQPTYLVVPAALETVAQQYTTQINPALGASVNPFIRAFRAIIVEPRLDATSAVDWYVFADPAAIDIIEYAYLAGQDGVYLEQQIGFTVDGIEIKARQDFGAGVLDFRGAVMSDN